MDYVTPPCLLRNILIYKIASRTFCPIIFPDGFKIEIEIPKPFLNKMEIYEITCFSHFWNLWIILEIRVETVSG